VCICTLEVLGKHEYAYLLHSGGGHVSQDALELKVHGWAALDTGDCRERREAERKRATQRPCALTTSMGFGEGPLV
jgi:hypothetical protein